MDVRNNVSIISVCAVVHCSAGIGRTGTVLYDLICADHLKHSGEVEFMGVVQDLRKSRARLIENQMQFKLCLQLLDEMLFGFENLTPSTELEKKLPMLISKCPEWFAKLNRFESPHTYSSASHNEYRHLNRSPDILPADTNRVFVQVRDFRVLNERAYFHNIH